MVLKIMDQKMYYKLILFFTFIFLTVASRKLKMTYVALFIISALDSTDTELLDRANSYSQILL